MADCVDTGDAHLDALQDELDAGPASFTLLKADPHRHGPGKVHLFVGGRTRCGKTQANCPGRQLLGDLELVTCGGCRNSHEADQRRRQQQREWEQQRAAREARRRQDSERWWAWYDNYLQSPEWKTRRDLVLRRANGVCEGCGRRDARHVHHLHYDRVGNEMLFDLVAVCVDCHDQIHAGKRAA